MEKVISIALIVVMALLLFVAGAATWAVLVAGGNWSDGPTQVFFQGTRTALGALGALVVVGAIYSLRRRLAAIEAKLDRS